MEALLWRLNQCRGNELEEKEHTHWLQLDFLARQVGQLWEIMVQRQWHSPRKENKGRIVKGFAHHLLHLRSTDCGAVQFTRTQEFLPLSRKGDHALAKSSPWLLLSNGFTTALGQGMKQVLHHVLNSPETMLVRGVCFPLFEHISPSYPQDIVK